MNFACDRCGKHYGLTDAKVPPGGFRATCKQCGNVIIVKPAPAPRPRLRTVAVPALARASAPPAPAPRPAAPAPRPPEADGHDQFFRGAPASPELSLSDEWVVSSRNRRPGVIPVLGAVLLVGLGAAAAWKAARPAAQDDAADGAGGRRPGWTGGGADQARRAAGAASLPPSSGLAPPPSGAPQRQRGGTAGSAGGRAPAGSQAPSRRGDAGAGKRDPKLLDLLDRKADAALVPVPAAGELSTGRASLDEATLRRALSARSSAFSACIARAAKADPGLRLQNRPLVLELVVRPSGRVSKAAMVDPRDAASPLGACVVATARRMVFPSFDGEEILVQAPLKLSAVQ